MGNASPYVLGIDLGTSACKVCLLTADGTVVGSARAGYAILSPQAGWAEQDPAAWLHAVTAATRQLLTATGVPAAAMAGIALTSAAHIGVLLDASGSPVRPAILWNDQRAVAEVDELEHLAGATILQRTFQAVSTSWTLPHLCWVRRHEPDVWARTRTVLLSKDFLLQWLIGRAVTDPATALSSQLYDPLAAQWCPELCALAGLAPAALPPVCSATTIAGTLTPSTADALGVRAGTPVVVGTLDSATELVAAGACAPGDRVIRLATAGGVEVVVSGPTPDRHRITYPHPVEPYWYCQAGTSTCAAAVQWGCELLGGADTVDYAAWDAWAGASAPGAEGVLFHPYLAGERAPHWDPHLRASFTGLSLRHGREQLARAIYEGTAYSIRQAMRALPAEQWADAPLAVVGGGAHSRVWLEILAGVLGRPLRAAPAADSALGAAALGLMALGLTEAPLASLAEAVPLIVPDPAAMALYADGYARYVEIHQRLAPAYARR